jgi:outer membrane protein TolC
MRRRRNRIVATVLGLLVWMGVHAADTAKVLSQEAFVNIVRAYHPVVLQSGLQVQRAGAEVMKARGAFDPTAGADLDRKTFDGKQYYSYFRSELAIPTWYGIDLKGGIEEVIGDRVSEESTLGKTAYAGVKVSTNSLLFDKRRAMLRQAQTMSDLSEAERRLAVNDLMLDAIYAYWSWVKEYQVYNVIRNTVRINEERLGFVRTEFFQGARPAIDTTEALAQLQSFYLQLNASRLAFANAGIELSNYLWLEDGAPAGWSEEIVPDSLSVMRGSEEADVPSLIALLDKTPLHPKVQSIGFKLDFLEIDKRLKSQYLIPKLSVSGNVLSKGYNVPTDFTATFLERNHKVGVDFSVPIFMREARGNYRSAVYKLQEAGLEKSRTELTVENKIRSYYNEVMALKQQNAIMKQAYNNYQKLYNGEQMRFEIGESSLFLLNTRENKLLETNQKLIELRIKWQQAYASLLWAAGILG